MLAFRLPIFVLLSTLLCLPAGRALAAATDVIILKNGDRISGTLIKVEKDVIVFAGELGGEARINTDAILYLRTVTPSRLRLDSGQVFKGTLLGHENRLNIELSDDHGQVSAEWSQIRDINVPLVVWQGGVWLGMSQKSGNSDTFDASFGGEASRRGERDRWSFSLRHNYAKSEGSLSARDTFGSLQYDYFFTPRFYGLLGVEMLKDRFKDLQLRSAVGPGVGFQVWEETRRALALEAGVTYFSENRIVAEDEDWFSARLAMRLRYRLASWLSFVDNLRVYPSLEDFGEFNLRNEASLITALGGSWALRFSNIWDHDSDPPPGTRRDDFHSSVNLQYSF